MDESENYDEFIHEAHRLIDELVNQSLAKIVEDERSENQENKMQKEKLSTYQWPTIAEFKNEKLGLEKISEYIEKEWKTSTINHDECWLYALDFLERKSFEFNDLYIYRVRYSIPTQRQPIPRHTASVYFSIDVSKIKPKNHPVEISFVFETKRLIHHPSTFRFRQNWLQDIILLKENLSKNIDF